MTSKNIKRTLCVILALIMTCSLMATQVFAEDPYKSYSYNAWAEALPSQNGYLVKDTITADDMGLYQLSDPTSPLFISEKEPKSLKDAKDFFLSEKNEFYIVDTGNNRILKTDVNFKLLACYKNFTGSKVTEPFTDAGGNQIKLGNVDLFMESNKDLTLDGNGNPIVPADTKLLYSATGGLALDKNDNPVIVKNVEQLVAANADLMLDGNGNPALAADDMLKLDASGKPELDANGNPVIVKDDGSGEEEEEEEEPPAEPALDENGNPIPTDKTSFILTKIVVDLKAPSGIYVDEDDIMYIADKDNQRIVKCNQNCEIITEYTKPDSELYASQSFYCTKVLVDAAKNVYVICPAVNKGAIMYSPSGNFIGYYGANRVEVTAEVIKNKIWRKFATESQIQSMVKSTPVEYANFDIDDEGFIYTVTEVANVSTDAVKKLNPAGNNILELTTNAADIMFGDQESVTYSGTTYATRLTDITIGDNGLINILDYSSGRVFQYDRECNLLFIFGCDQEQQNSGFDNPNAVECLGNLVYVLDGRNQDVTIFEETLFGAYVHKAVELFNRGLYEEAMDYWLEVIKRDGNYNMAYVALGRAYLNHDDYDNAIKYFKLAFENEDYDRAFESRRQEMLRKNFTLIVILIIVLIVIWIVINILKKKGKIPQKLWKTFFKWIWSKIKPGFEKIIAKGGKNK